MEWRLGSAKVLNFILKKQKYILYGLATYLVIIWTIIRFVSRTTIYDLITQQLVARAWAHGNFAPISLGTTHYLFKIILLYIPAEFLPGNARPKLIIMSLIVNLFTIFLMALLASKLLSYFKVDSKNVPISVVWLAAISGSAFWINFTNSRNLEVAGGMILILWTLRLVERRRKFKSYMAITLFASVLFFSDTLQVYMTAVPLLVYTFIAHRKYVIPLAIAMISGFTLSKGLFLITSKIFNITYSGGSFTNGNINLLGAIRSTVVLFAGSTDVGILRVGVNIFFLVIMVYSFLFGLRKCKIPVNLGLFVAVFIVCNEAVYIVSGQASQSHTSRYLIMLVPIMMLVIASAYRMLPKKLTYIVFGLLVLVNTCGLTYKLYSLSTSNLNSDKHLSSVKKFISAHPSSLAYASMDTALPLSYYENDSNTDYVALACAQPNLVKAHSVPRPTVRQDSSSYAPIFLDGQSIDNSPLTCTVTSIIAQLGEPHSIDKTEDGSTVMYYPKNKIENLKF